MPGILNYTTEIGVGRTIGEIQEMLRVHGASDVMVSYDDDRNPTKVQFMIKTQWGPRPFALSANVRGVYTVLCAQASNGKVARRFASEDQAQRVSWRIIREWLASQLAMIEASLVTIEQALLPYMSVRPDKTLYQVLDEGKLSLPSVNDGRFQLPEPSK